EGCGRPSRARRCRTAKYRMAFPERKVQKLQSCHYRVEGQYKSGWCAGFLRTTLPAPASDGCQKEAVRASERPKSREETPVLGCGAKKCSPRPQNLYAPVRLQRQL